MSLDLWQVAQTCLALLIIVVTVSLVALILFLGASVVAGLTKKGEGGEAKGFRKDDGK